MSLFQLVKCRFPPLQTQQAVEIHLSEVLRGFRRPRAVVAPDEMQEAELADDPSDAKKPQLVRLTDDDVRKISRRARALTERRKAASGMAHLKKEESDRLLPLRDGVRLVRIASEHRADEIAAALHDEFPWMGRATEMIWQEARKSVREGWPAIHFSPVLIVGPPGTGKSTWARHLASAINTPSVVVEATVESASFGILGSQRGWGNSTPGRLVNTLLRTHIGNPITIIDEVEKAGTVISKQGHSFDLCDGLLPLLEPLTAKSWICPYFEVPFDMSLVSWVLTANSIELIPAPLRSRCPPIHVGLPSTQDLMRFADQIGRRRGVSDEGIGIMQEVLKARKWPETLSLRTVLRMVERAQALESKARPH